MLGLLKYPDDFLTAQVLNQLWYKDTATTAAKADNNGFAARHAYLIQSKEKFKSSVVDIQIKANFTENGPSNTRVFALVISDKMLSFQSDGNKMSVIF